MSEVHCEAQEEEEEATPALLLSKSYQQAGKMYQAFEGSHLKCLTLLTPRRGAGSRKQVSPSLYS